MNHPQCHSTTVYRKDLILSVVTSPAVYASHGDDRTLPRNQEILEKVLENATFKDTWVSN